jgi:hypothetical protein
MMRKSDRAGFAVTTDEQGDRLTLKIDAMKPDGAFLNQLPITVHALRQDVGSALAVEPSANVGEGTGGEESVSVRAEQVAPGAYAAGFDIPSQGTTLFSISSPDLPDGGTTFGYTRSYRREFLSSETNESLLRQIAELGHGAFDPAPAEVWRLPSKSTPQRQDLTDRFLIAALLLIPFDIWLRRRS